MLLEIKSVQTKAGLDLKNFFGDNSRASLVFVDFSARGVIQILCFRYISIKKFMLQCHKVA